MRLESSRYYRFGDISFPVAELASLEAVLLAMFPDPKPTNFEISFQNVNKQTMVAERIEELTSDNYLIPVRLANPSISASSNVNNMRYSVLIGPKQKVGNDGKIETRYGLFLDTEDSGWHARVDTLLAWLRGHRTWYSGVPQILLVALLFAIIIGSAFVAMPPNGHTTAYVIGGAALTGVAALATLMYLISLPTVTIIVRPDTRSKLLPSILAIITAVSALLTAISSLKSLFGKP